MVQTGIQNFMIRLKIEFYILHQQSGFANTPTPANAYKPVVPIHLIHEIPDECCAYLSIFFIKTLDQYFHDLFLSKIIYYQRIDNYFYLFNHHADIFYIRNHIYTVGPVETHSCSGNNRIFHCAKFSHFIVHNSKFLLCIIGYSLIIQLLNVNLHGNFTS